MVPATVQDANRAKILYSDRSFKLQAIRILTHFTVARLTRGAAKFDISLPFFDRWCRSYPLLFRRIGLSTSLQSENARTAGNVRFPRLYKRRILPFVSHVEFTTQIGSCAEFRDLREHPTSWSLRRNSPNARKPRNQCGT